jgi:hypothetical protein
MPARHVRRLHIRAEAEQDAQGAATLITDALSTATMPMSDRGRLIVIRRLPLGRISPRASPASIALQIERAARDAMAEAVLYDLPSAGSANAVVFPDRSEAIITLARDHARRAVTSEWFWPSVVPGWQTVPGPSREERWSVLLDAAHSVPGAAIVSAAVVEEAIQAGVEGELLSSIPPGQAAKWLRLEGFNSAPRITSTPREQLPELRRTQLVQQWRRQCAPGDDRLIWLVTMLVVKEHPLSAADPSLPARVATALARAGASASVSAQRESSQTIRDQLSSSVETTRVAEVRKPGAELDFASRKQVETSEASTFEDVSLDRSAAPGPQIPRPESPVTADLPNTPIESSSPSSTEPTIELAPGEDAFLEQPRRLHGPFTAFAGVFFLVPILQRLGFAKFLAARPELLESGFPWRLLWYAATRVGLTPEDPLSRAIETEPMDHADLRAWLTALRRWSRRELRMGLVALIRRSGRVTVSRTHIDVVFKIPQIDLRLRRQAVDVDPGWVPWLGHVLRFHYVKQDERTS